MEGLRLLFMFVALLLPVMLIALVGIFRLGLGVYQGRAGATQLTAIQAARQKRWRLAGVVILVVGLLAAGVVYQTAPADEASGALGYEIDGGALVPVMPGDSKAYDQQMQGVGGGVSELAAELAGWFQGRKLAYTLAVLAVGGVLGCFAIGELEARSAEEK